MLQARVHLGKVKPGKFTSSSLRLAPISDCKMLKRIEEGKALFYEGPATIELK